MKAQELANYFSKKVTKPITYTVDEVSDRSSRAPERTYAIEPIGVSDDNVLHALVTLKGRTSYGASVCSVRTTLFPVAGPHAARMTTMDGSYGMLLQEIAQAESFVFVALVTLTVIAILDLFLPHSGG